MTTTSSETAAPAVEMVTGTIDGSEVSVPKGTMIIRAAELVGTEVPRFCDHPLLEPVAACRQCLVEIEGMPKPQPSCAIPLGDGMVVRTQLTSEVADIAQQAVMEFLLINHPLDCPVCDKGGECPLQNQAMSTGRSESRFDLPKRQFPKPVPLSTQVLLDRERCVSCARCTRFADQIAGDPLIALTDRGSQQQIGIGEVPFDSYFSGNTIQICPVGALTSAEYRFRSRPFDLVSVPTTCEHCASGCALRTDYRHEKVMRRQAWDDPEVNEEWNCDKGRFAFPYLSQHRLEQPLVREDGQLRFASWPEALRRAAEGLAAARGHAAVLTGGRLTLEDAYAYARFARVSLRTDDVDLRARPTGPDEAAFLAARVAGTAGPTYRDLEAAPAVLLVAFEPEDESPIVFLRLRKAASRGTKVLSVAPFESAGLDKLDGTLIPAVPGREAAALAELSGDARAALTQPGAIVMVGERAAASPGTLAAAAALADSTGARLAWVPRRAGERGALDAGCLPGLLPGGRPLADPVARREVAGAWGLAADELPVVAGRSLAEVVAAIEDDRALAFAASQEDPHEPAIAALLVAGVDPEDVPDPDAFLAAIEHAPFVVSMETRPTEVTARADVVLPVAVVLEKAGTFVDWEGRRRPFAQALPEVSTFSDATVLAMIADAMDDDTAPRTVAALRAEIESLGGWAGERSWEPHEQAPGAAVPQADEAVLATWRLLLDLGALQQGEPHLAGTRRPTVARLSAATLASVGATEGESIRVSTDHGSVVVPALVTDMADGIVWLPANSPGSRVGVTLRAGPGDTVRLGRGEPGA